MVNEMNDNERRAQHRPAHGSAPDVRASKADLERWERYANERLAAEGLAASGWTFVWTRGLTQFGRCRYADKTIGVSKKIAMLNGDEQVHDTILHEIAHAIVGPRVGHGPEWKAVATRIGARPERCYSADDVDTPTLKYLGECPGCRTQVERQRLSERTRKLCCALCHASTGKYRTFHWRIHPDYSG